MFTYEKVWNSRNIKKESKVNMSGFRLAYEKGEKRAVVCGWILLMYKQIDTAGGRKSLDGF